MGNPEEVMSAQADGALRYVYTLFDLEENTDYICRLFQSGKHSDLVLRCSDGSKFKVHKAVVCVQSKFFEKACEPESFRVSQISNHSLPECIADS